METAKGFKVGDKVEWSSQAMGCYRTKVGEVVEVVPAGRTPQANLKDIGWGRDHESYVVRASVVGRKARKTYWPRAAALRAVPL